ncbi:MAG: T9SS C-terminal target domain-containing protein [Calditrichaeota bacterium]|nr:MAG: T9SS C-terminal target domain-containing protein [Calditrichota bacterium]MBL1207178.1 T9SS C-terminal target domain-containing protein [Calditrichota bacterium]NOG47011.1 T9SS type A sorting domain-containing protein [Calditrichota bacterium]
MKSIVLILTIFSIATFCSAQEPEWELITDDYLVSALAIDPTDSQVLYIDGGNGFYKTINGGVTWDTIGTGLNNRPVKLIVDHKNSNVLWAGGPTPRTGVLPEWMAIAKSIDGALSWFKSDSGIANYVHGDQIFGLEIDRTRNFLYAYDNVEPVYQSTDGGQYWKNIGATVPGGKDLAVDEDDGTLYFASNGVWKKGLEEEQWTSISEGLPKDQFGYLSVRQIVATKNSNTIYCVVDTIGNGSIQRVYKSYNNGAKWFSLDLFVSSPSEIMVLESDTNTVILASQTAFYPDTLVGGVFISRNGGNSWAINYNGLPDSLPYMSCENLKYDASINVIYAYLGLFNRESVMRGLYKLKLSKPTTIQDKNTISKQNFFIKTYPNPFNDKITILYDLLKTEFVYLMIYNINGKEVKNLVNQTEQDGFHKISWDGKNEHGEAISGGIYFVQIRMGNSIFTRKVIYLP